MVLDPLGRGEQFAAFMIKKMKYPGYFLITWDFIRYAREQGIPVGPGRGSAAGSFVAYCLRITDVDPIEYDLIFERFLNPERVSLPDIDIDFCERRRGEVIEYVTRKYGRENVAQIITFGTMMVRKRFTALALTNGCGAPGFRNFSARIFSTVRS